MSIPLRLPQRWRTRKRLQDTYLPKRATTVRLADEARRRSQRERIVRKSCNFSPEKLQLVSGLSSKELISLAPRRGFEPLFPA
jgi:hypothetical protein